jgi:hypothetical protein
MRLLACTNPMSNKNTVHYHRHQQAGERQGTGWVGGGGDLLFGYFYFIGHPCSYLVWFGEDRRQKGDFTLWVSRSRACGIEWRTFVESPKTWAENT